LHRLLAGHASTELAYVQPFTTEQIGEYLRRACGNEYDRVSAQISSIYGFGDMAKTPVLLAMMRRTVPEMVAEGHKFTIVPQLDLYSSYTQRWIYRDDKRAQLSSKQRLHLSRSLAVSLIRKDDYAAPWREIRDLLYDDDSWHDMPVSDAAAEFDVRNSTFLMRESDDSFRFVHRSIMEYFAAMESYEKIVSGAPAEVSLTDGHAKFLAMFLALHWHTTNKGSLPFTKPQFNLDDWRDQKLLALVSSATMLFPKDEVKPRLSTILIGDECEQCNFSCIDAVGFTITLNKIGRLRFDDCNVRDLSIVARQRAGAVEFVNCSIEKSSIALSLEGWKAIRIAPIDDSSASTVTTLGLPLGYEMASRWVEHPGCSANVEGARWTVPHRCLVVASAAAKRLFGRGKISINTWGKGSYGKELTLLLPKLLSAGLVAEDTSRRPHQLSLTAAGNTLFAGIQKNPIPHQPKLLIFDP
jgi:hypothetical protein